MASIKKGEELTLLSIIMKMIREKKTRWETFKTYAEAHKRRAEIYSSK